MSDRESILGAIKAANRSAQFAVDQIEKEAADLVANPEDVQPKFEGVSLLDRFIAKATSERVTATVDQVVDMADVPVIVSEYLSQAAQNGAVTVQESGPLDEMDWSKLNRTSVLAEDGGIAVTLAEFGIAETGSVVFRSGSHGPILQNFLPLYHIVVLKASTLLAYPEDLWSHLGGKSAPQSRLLTIVTGTSGTADIEAKNVRGAHGPRFMHIIVVLD